MRISRLVLLLSCLIPASAEIALAGEPHDAIVEMEKGFVATFMKGDAAGLAALYTEDGQVLPPNSDFVNGREAIQGMWQSFMEMGIKGLKLETVEVEGCENMASEVGKYTLEGEDGQVLDQGKYIVIWKKEGDKWMMHRDIFNTSMAAPE